MRKTLAKNWLTRWKAAITRSARTRYCDREMGEQVGWLISPFLGGFYYGYLATGDAAWIARTVDWADAWIRRGVEEPDGYIGWPKSGTGSAYSPPLNADSLTGEAMALRPLVLAAGTILQTPALEQEYGRKAEEYLRLAEQVFAKWDARGCWREVEEGGLWVVSPYGIDRRTRTWTKGYERRETECFSNPNNRQNQIASWLITMHDVTGKAVYRQRAEKWWQLMKTRVRTRLGGKYLVWNYWDPGGPWDYAPDGSPRHPAVVHSNGGYYAFDVQGMVTAYEHGLVFTREDLDRLIATNRDFMWNGKIEGAQFRRIDGEEPDPRWAHSPGVLWFALVPHDETLRKVFEATHDPASWGGLSITPRYLAEQTEQTTAA